MRAIPALGRQSRGHSHVSHTDNKVTIVDLISLLSLFETRRSIQPGYVLLCVTRDRG
jgi:hypothetical protein